MPLDVTDYYRYPMCIKSPKEHRENQLNAGRMHCRALEDLDYGLRWLNTQFHHRLMLISADGVLAWAGALLSPESRVQGAALRVRKGKEQRDRDLKRKRRILELRSREDHGRRQKFIVLSIIGHTVSAWHDLVDTFADSFLHPRSPVRILPAEHCGRPQLLPWSAPPFIFRDRRAADRILK